GGVVAPPHRADPPGALTRPCRSVRRRVTLWVRGRRRERGDRTGDGTEQHGSHFLRSVEGASAATEEPVLLIPRPRPSTTSQRVAEAATLRRRRELDRGTKPR